MGRVARIAATGGIAYPITAAIVADSPPIVVSASDIIIADSFAIWRAPRAGGLLQHVAAVGAPVYSLATDGTSIYWLDTNLRIYGAPLTGGSPVLLAASPYVDRVGRLSYVDGMLYWSAGSEGIMSLPTGGGIPSLVATSQVTPREVIVDEPGIYYSAPPLVTMSSRTTGHLLWDADIGEGSAYAALAVDASSVFVLTRFGISQVDKSTGRVLMLSLSGPADDYPGISTDAGVVYWTDPSTREILSVRAFGTDAF